MNWELPTHNYMYVMTIKRMHQENKMDTKNSLPQNYSR